MTKYKYYFRQPRSAIVRDIILAIGALGVLTIAASSPYFATNLLRAYKRNKKFPKEKIVSTFYRLKREGLFDVERRNHQIFISLTERGRKKARWMQINDLKIVHPKKWDCVWRIVIFDIAHNARGTREAFRGFLIRLGFYRLQKSVWVYPYSCKDEIGLLKDFFALNNDELRIIEARSIGEDYKLKKIFQL